MAGMMKFDLVSPERSLASVEASAVQIPGAEGDFTAMPDHAPVITTLRPGLLEVSTSGGLEEYFVTGGFAEVSPESTSVLAERAYAKADLTAEIMEGLVKDANMARDSASTDAAAKYADDMAAAARELGY